MRQYNTDKQHKKGKLHAFERIALLLDNDSFREETSDKTSDYDGVIAGSGTIFGKSVFVFAQDYTVSGGAITLNHGRKIADIIKKATAEKCPVIGIYDSVGAEITGGVNALAGCGEIMSQNVKASGIIPQIAVVVGPCAGAAAYSTALNDFVFVVDGISQLYITGNKVIECVTGKKCDLYELGGAEIHASVSGNAHFRCDNEKECFFNVRRLISFLPQNREDKKHLVSDGFSQTTGDASAVVPENQKKTYSMSEFIETVFDDNSFIEVQSLYAQNVIVGFAKLCGITVGVVGNNPRVKAGCLDIDSSDKAARFVRFCDGFSIPVVTFVDTPGYLPGLDEERGGIIRHGAKVLFAYSEADTIKITYIVRKAYGGAYIAMGSKHVGADRVYISPISEIAVMGAESAVSILHHKEFENPSPDISEMKSNWIKEYKNRYINSNAAISAGYADEISDFKDIRKHIYDDIITLKTKKIIPITKKHGNIPL